MVDALGPLAQAVEAFGRAGVESDPECRSRAGGRRGGLDHDRAGGAGPDPDAQPLARKGAYRARDGGLDVGHDRWPVAGH
jgi:hypothetical protein